MAEGGLPPRMDSHLLECPICLDRLQQPKSLPCLHSFTKELSGKMASATSFTCPVCRRMTSPVNQKETKDEWAEQFPTNLPVIHDLIQLKERRVKEVGRFYIKSPSDKNDCAALGILYLPCARIVVSDYYNKKLKLFTAKGKYLDELTVRRNPRDMCLVNNYTVAVTVERPGGIHVVNVEASKLSLSSEINMLHEDCCGITHTDGRFIVGTGGGQVYSVTQDGATELLYKYNSTCLSLTNDPIEVGTLVSVRNTTTGEVAVSRMSADERCTDLMKVSPTVLKGARGIDVDKEGNIYVCGKESHNVLKMSRDGTHVRKLLTSSEGIIDPRAISVRGDTFVVTDNGNTDEKNYIRVFQMY